MTIRTRRDVRRLPEGDHLSPVAQTQMIQFREKDGKDYGRQEACQSLAW